MADSTSALRRMTVRQGRNASEHPSEDVASPPTRSGAQDTADTQPQPVRADVPHDVAPGNHGLINVYVVHGQPLIAESLGLELGSLEDMAVVGVDMTADGVEPRILDRHAHVVVLDAELGAERLCQIIAATKAATRSLIIANEHDTALMHACMLVGAIGVLNRPRGFLEVAAAVRRANDGRIVLTQQQLAAIMSHSATRQADAAARAVCERLSEREREILTVLATGASTAMVATRLHISRHTVQSHIKNALHKLNVRSKLTAVVLMMAAGMIDME